MCGLYEPVSHRLNKHSGSDPQTQECSPGWMVHTILHRMLTVPQLFLGGSCQDIMDSYEEAQRQAKDRQWQRPCQWRPRRGTCEDVLEDYTSAATAGEGP